MILKSEEAVHVFHLFHVLSVNPVPLSFTVAIPEESVYLTALNSSLSEYSVSSARTAAEPHALLPDLWMPRSPVPVSLVSVIASLSHHQFSAFQNTFYPLTDRFLYSLINGSERFHRMLILSCCIFSLYQHDGDTFFLFDAF